jgi:hypothetical protein
MSGAAGSSLEPQASSPKPQAASEVTERAK